MKNKAWTLFNFLLSCTKLQFSRYADSYAVTWPFIWFKNSWKRDLSHHPPPTALIIYIYSTFSAPHNCLKSLCSKSDSHVVCRILGQCCPVCCTGSLYLPGRNCCLTLELPEDHLSVLSACDHCGAQLIHPHGCDSTCAERPLSQGRYFA